MKEEIKINSWLKSIIAISLLGFVLSFQGMQDVMAVRAQERQTQNSTSGFSWEYLIDFSDPSPASANQQASSLVQNFQDKGVTSELQSLGGESYRMVMRGNQGVEQVRQVLFSPLITSFIGGPADVEINMPVSNNQNIAVMLESNLTTGYQWEVVPVEGTGFYLAGEPTFSVRSEGYGVPTVQSMVLTPKNVGEGKIKLVYRRSFEPDETVIRHLRITLAEQVEEIDLSDPDPTIINADYGSSDSSIKLNPIEELHLKGVLPTSMDWRSSGIVPDPRDQGACGGCWSFGTVGIMESAIAKAGGPLTDLSEQFLISCNTRGWSCSGGLTANKYHYDTLGKNQSVIGAVLEVDKPYSATNGTCSVPLNHPYRLSGWQFIVPNEWTMPTVDQIKNAIATYGPVTAGVCVGSAFEAYSGGIFSTDETSTCPGATFKTNHQIILVGWNDAGGYWILRNSWGPSWGESGYMRIAYNTSRVGEGTSWVTWSNDAVLSKIFLPLVLRGSLGVPPGTFQKSSPSNGATSQSTSPALSWGISSNASSYEYCIDTSNNNACNASWVSVAANTGVGLSGLVTSTQYFWQVRANNASGTTYANSGTWWTFTTTSSPPTSGIINGDFESGSTGWTSYSYQGWDVIVDSFPGSVTPRSGSYAAWLGGDDDEINYVQQQVTISALAPYLVYWHWIASEDICGYDFGGVLINGSEVDVYDLCSGNDTGGWVKHTVNLGAYVGQSVTLQIRAETDEINNSNLFIDDVSLQASASSFGSSDVFTQNMDASINQAKVGILLQGEKPKRLEEIRFFINR